VSAVPPVEDSGSCWVLHWQHCGHTWWPSWVFTWQW